MNRIRLGALALIAAGVLFVLYPAFRPWHDESTVEGAIKSMSSNAWVASHLFAMIGFILVPLGLLAMRKVVSETRAENAAFTAFVLTWIGAGLTLPYYGAEDFGLNTIAKKAAEGQSLDVVGLAEAFRYGPVAVAMFAGGLLALAVGAVLAGVAVWRSGVLPRWSGVAFALGFALFLPQFFTTPAIRIGHGVLVGIGCVWLATALWRSAATKA